MAVRELYTDGACSGNPGFGGWAYWLDGVVDKDMEENATNNIMEMYAVLMGLMACKQGDVVHVYTDSKLVVGWLVRGYKVNKPYIAAVKEAIEAVRDALDLHVVLHKIKGHQTCTGNIIADHYAHRMAVECRERFRCRKVTDPRKDADRRNLLAQMN
jgi:ribonuclease HI